MEGLISSDAVTTEIQLHNYYTMCRRNTVLAATNAHKDLKKAEKKNYVYIIEI
jgi:hypothetical protein